MPELGHFVKRVQRENSDVVVAQIQGGETGEGVERVVRQSCEVEGVGEPQVLQGVAHLPVHTEDRNFSITRFQSILLYLIRT